MKLATVAATASLLGGLSLAAQSPAPAAAAQAHPAQELTDVVPANTRIEAFALAADESRTYYVNAGGEAWLYDRTTKSTSRIAAGPLWDLNVSPTGNALAYTKGGGQRGDQFVWTIGLNSKTGFATGKERQLSRLQGDTPSISPDGTSVAFARDDATGVGQSVIAMPLAGGAERVVASTRSSSIADIRWMPDGKTLYLGVNPPVACVPEWSCLPLAQNLRQPPGSIQRVAVTGGTVTTLTTTRSPSPGLSPDGTTMVYLDGAGSNRRLIIANPDGAQRDTLALQSAEMPAGWLRGSTLLLTSSSGGTIRRIRAVDLSDARTVTLLAVASLTIATAPQKPHAAPTYTQVHALKPREGVFAYARISPDGRKLVYASQLPAHPGVSRDWTETVVDLTTKKVLFTESGIDAYWSPEGTKIIYSGSDGVTVRNVETGATVVSAGASGLGDYYSWAKRDGRDLILTIQSNYYYLDHDKAVLPPAKVSRCDSIGGTGDRPLISKDGRRITTFVKGNVVVRGLDNCNDIFDTGIQGAKADFSWDGRYIAFHAIKSRGDGYEIKIVDVEQRTIRTLPNLAGSALFPSWTQDGRLCFRYDGADYRGFMMASGVLDINAVPLPAVAERLPAERTWQDIFPDTPAPTGRMAVVLIWAPWSVHSRDAFEQLAEAREYLSARIPGLIVMEAADPGSREADVVQQLADFHVTMPRVKLSSSGLLLTEGRNQMPTTLVFKDGVLVDRRLGAQSAERLREWIGGLK